MNNYITLGLLFNYFILLFLSCFNLVTAEDWEHYDYLKVTSWDKYKFELNSSYTYQVAKFTTTPKTEKGDIVLQISETLSTAEICIYTDWKDIKTTEETISGVTFTWFENCKWFFNTSDVCIVKSGDEQYVLNGDYYIAVYIKNMLFGGDVLFFNELDTKIVEGNSKVVMKNIYSSKKMTFKFTEIENSFLVFSFYFKEDPDKIKEYTGYLAITDSEGKLIHKWTDLNEPYPYKNFKLNDTEGGAGKDYFIEVHVDEPEYPSLNYEIEIDTMGERPNKFVGNVTLRKTFIYQTNYIFYTDISEFNINEEGVVEILIGNEEVIKNGTLEIHNSLLGCDEKDIGPAVYPSGQIFQPYTRRRPDPNGLFLSIPYMRIGEEHKFFIITLYVNTEINIGDVVFTFVPRFVYFHLSMKNFTDLPEEKNGIVTTDVIEFRGKMPTYTKITFDEDLLKENNLVFMIPEGKQSSIIVGPIMISDKPNYDYKNNDILVIDKKGPMPHNKTITFSLIGEINKSQIQITMVNDEILFFNNTRLINQPFNLELVNCNKKLIFVESYESSKEGENNSTLYITPLYGKYELFQSHKITSPKLYTSGIRINSNLVEVEKNNIAVLLQCTKPTSLLFTYVSPYQETKSTIVDGDEFIYQFDEPGRIYEFTLGNDIVSYLYKVVVEILSQAPSYTVLNVAGNTKIYHTKLNEIFDVAGSNDATKKKFTIQVGESAIIRIKFSSNMIYNRIVEGNTDISYEMKKSIFKLKHDNNYDYVQIKFYSKKDVQLIKMKYLFNKYGDKDNAPLPVLSRDFSEETTFIYSNPYNKFDSLLEENESYYFSIEFLNENKDDYNVFADIKYISNKGTAIPCKEGLVVNQGEPYRVTPESKYNIVNAIAYNIITCDDPSKSKMSIETYYNAQKEYVMKDEIISTRQFILHEYNYYGTTISLKSENETSQMFFNYFLLHEDKFPLYTFADNYTIGFEDLGKNIRLSWNVFVRDKSEIPTKYYIFVYDNTSNLDTICSFNTSLYNFTVDNAVTFEYEIPPGDYVVNIVAKVQIEILPAVTIYNAIQITVPKRSNILMWTLIVAGCVIVLFIIVFYLLRMRKSRKPKFMDKDEDGDMALLKKENPDIENMELFAPESNDNSRSNSHVNIKKIDHIN